MADSVGIDFAGKNVVLVGRMKTMSSTVARQHIQSLGGINRNTPRGTTHIFVVGDGGGAKAARTRTRFAGAATFLTEAEFAEAIAALEEKTEEPVPLGEALGELRSAFDGAPNRESWERAVAAIDAAPEAEREAMVRYVGSHTERWPNPWGGDDAPRDPGSTFRPDSGLELCTPPSAWWLRLIERERAPEFGLLREISFGYKKVNGTIGSKIVTHPDLVNLRSLDLGEDNKLSKTFFKKLRTSPVMSNLEALHLYELDEARAAELCGEHTLTSLKHVLLRHSDTSYGAKTVSGLFGASWWGQIEGLYVENLNGYYGNGQMANGLFGRELVRRMGALERLRHLRIGIPGASDLLASDALLDRIERLSLFARSRRNLEALSKRMKRSNTLEVLDLSSDWPRHMRGRSEDEIHAVAELFFDEEVLGGLSEFIVNASHFKGIQRMVLRGVADEVGVKVTWVRTSSRA